MDSLGLNVSGVSAKNVQATAEAQRHQKTSHTVMAGSSIAGLPEEISGGAYGLPPPETGYINSVDMEMLLFAERTVRERKERDEAEALAKYRLATSAIALKSQKQYVKAVNSIISMSQGGNNTSNDAEVKGSSTLLPKIVRKRKLKPEDTNALSVGDHVIVTAKKRLLSASDEDSCKSGVTHAHIDEDEIEEPSVLKGLVAYSSGSEDEEVHDNPRGTSDSA